MPSVQVAGPEGGTVVGLTPIRPTADVVGDGEEQPPGGDVAGFRAPSSLATMVMNVSPTTVATLVRGGEQRRHGVGLDRLRRSRPTAARTYSSTNDGEPRSSVWREMSLPVAHVCTGTDDDDQIGRAGRDLGFLGGLQRDLRAWSST